MESQQDDIIIQLEPPEMTQSETQPNTCTTTTTTELINSPIHSPISSPSHEFSFTISLDSAATSCYQHRETASAIDLTPADDIFFHGHLLPLHFLSHLHASSPRSSTTSRDSSYTAPFAKPEINSLPTEDQIILNNSHNKGKSFSLSGFTKWVKGQSSEPKERTRKPKFDVAQFVKRYIKMVKPLLSPKGGNHTDKYECYSFSGSLNPRLNKGGEHTRSVRGEYSAPASFSASLNPRLNKVREHRQTVRGEYSAPASFSASLNPRLNQGGEHRRGAKGEYSAPVSFTGSLNPRLNKGGEHRRTVSRGQYSAPASMRTSPTNSGLLVATADVQSWSQPVSDSTMDELHSAIQAAIAHCKNSTSNVQHKSSQDLLSPVPVN